MAVCQSARDGMILAVVALASRHVVWRPRIIICGASLVNIGVDGGERFSNFLWQIIYMIGDFFVPLQAQNNYCKFKINNFKIREGQGL